MGGSKVRSVLNALKNFVIFTGIFIVMELITVNVIYWILEVFN